jgi:hypothetical protein
MVAGSGRSIIGLGLEILGGAAVNYWPAVAIPVMLLGAGLMLWGGWDWWRTEGRAQVQAWQFLLAGIVGTWLFVTVALGAAAWMVWFDQGFAIGQSHIPGDDGPMQWFRNLTLYGGPLQGGGLNVFTLKFRGANISQKEVELKSASIISAINGTKLPLEIIAQKEIVPLDQVELIPPGAPVELIAKFGPPDPNAPEKILGLEPKTFLETWRQFSLNIQDDTKSYRIAFNEGDLALFFPGMVGPHVTKKPDDKKK